MELHDQITKLITDYYDQLLLPREVAAAILELPEIKEAMEAKQFAYNEGYQDGLAVGREEA